MRNIHCLIPIVVASKPVEEQAVVAGTPCSSCRRAAGLGSRRAPPWPTSPCSKTRWCAGTCAARQTGRCHVGRLGSRILEVPRRCRGRPSLRSPPDQPPR